jgi:diketogulonate reductase-like aldo/keto reductase
MDTLLSTSTVVPALNQIELHPGLQQSALHEYNRSHGIATEGWSPLDRGRFAANPVLTEVAKKHGKTVTQVIIRWHLDLGNLVIPKTSNPERLKENIDVFDFVLDAEDLASIATLNTDERHGPDPEEFG